MSEPVHRTIHANGIDIHVAEQGEGPLVLLCHGFPELWRSWRHQLPALAEAGYHAVAPDMRGYGETDRPADPAEYDFEHLGGDLVGVMDALGEERAVVVGHDWGAIVTWAMPYLHPDRVRAVVGLSVGYAPRLPAPPTRFFKMAFGERFFYILYFQELGVADEELARDPRRTLLSFMWSISGEAPPGSVKDLPAEGGTFLGSVSDAPGVPEWLGEEELGRYVDAFTRTGFTGGLNYYRNFDRNWELMEPFATEKITHPALYIVGERDPVLLMTPPQMMDGWVTDLRGTVILPGAGHWTQQERPAEVNRALLDFLAGL